MKKIITVMAALTMAVTLGACSKKAASSGTVSSEKTTQSPTKLQVVTNKKKPNNLGNVLITIKTNSKAKVKITNTKTKKVANLTADADGKLIFNAHLGEHTKEAEFMITATAKHHQASGTQKFKVYNDSAAYHEWEQNQSSAAESSSSAEESSSVDEQSSSADDSSAEVDITAGDDVSSAASSSDSNTGTNTTGTAGGGYVAPSYSAPSYSYPTYQGGGNHYHSSTSGGSASSAPSSNDTVSDQADESDTDAAANNAGTDKVEATTEEVTESAD